MRWASRSWRASHHDLGGGREHVEAALVDAEEAGVRPAFEVHEPNVGEELEVMGHRRLADVDGLDDLADGQGTRCGRELVKDQHASGVTQGPEPARPDLRRGTIDSHRSSTIVD
jgi:hypothetical protein